MPALPFSFYVFSEADFLYLLSIGELSFVIPSIVDAARVALWGTRNRSDPLPLSCDYMGSSREQGSVPTWVH